MQIRMLSMCVYRKPLVMCLLLAVSRKRELKDQKAGVVGSLLTVPARCFSPLQHSNLRPKTQYIKDLEEWAAAWPSGGQ